MYILEIVTTIPAFRGFPQASGYASIRLLYRAALVRFRMPGGEGGSRETPCYPVYLINSKV